MAPGLDQMLFPGAVRTAVTTLRERSDNPWPATTLATPRRSVAASTERSRTRVSQQLGTRVLEGYHSRVFEGCGARPAAGFARRLALAPPPPIHDYQDRYLPPRAGSGHQPTAARGRDWPMPGHPAKPKQI